MGEEPRILNMNVVSEIEPVEEGNIHLAAPRRENLTIVVERPGSPSLASAAGPSGKLPLFRSYSYTVDFYVASPTRDWRVLCAPLESIRIRQKAIICFRRGGILWYREPRA